MWRSTIKRFLLRFIICLVVLGGLYAATIGFSSKSPLRTHSANSQLLILRGHLDETLIETTVLAQFKQSDPATASALNQMVAAYQSNGASLTTASQKSGRLLTHKQLQSVNQVRTAQKQALDRYKVSFQVVSKLLSYDPATDLGQLSVDSKASVISARATAAAKGLRHAASETSSAPGSNGLNVGSATDSAQLLNSASQAVITDEAGCFERLAAQLDANQSAVAKQTLAVCTMGYGKVRLVAAQGITSYCFGTDYQQYAKQRLTGLLNELDANASTSKH